MQPGTWIFSDWRDLNYLGGGEEKWITWLGFLRDFSQISGSKDPPALDWQPLQWPTNPSTLSIHKLYLLLECCRSNCRDFLIDLKMMSQSPRHYWNCTAAPNLFYLTPANSTHLLLIQCSPIRFIVSCLFIPNRLWTHEGSNICFVLLIHVFPLPRKWSY